jgi:hypothetical protein
VTQDLSDPRSAALGWLRVVAPWRDESGVVQRDRLYEWMRGTARHARSMAPQTLQETAAACEYVWGELSRLGLVEARLFKFDDELGLPERVTGYLITETGLAVLANFTLLRGDW